MKGPFSQSSGFSSSHIWMWELDYKESWRIDALEDSWVSLGLQGDQTSQSERKSVQNINWKDWCWSWNSSNLAAWCKELIHLKRPWYWERLNAGGEWDDRGWDGWMASLTQWTRVWVNSSSLWWTGRPGMLRFMGSGRKESDTTEQLNWTDDGQPHIKYIFTEV